MRLEIRLNAFAADVLTVSDEHVQVIASTVDRELEDTFKTSCKEGRIVAFSS